MNLSTFNEKASQMGDFYVYYTNRQGKPTFSVCTNEFSKYMKVNLKNKDPFNQVLLWNYSANRPVLIPLSSIRKLVPLGTVLKNERFVKRSNL